MAMDLGKQIIVLEFRLNMDDLLEATRAKETPRKRGTEVHAGYTEWFQTTNFL